MGPETKAQLAEFTRRLKLALKDAPNHVRMEAALEVESHVCEVLARGGEGEEHERVARILAGFGSPEEYARALIRQMPAVEAVTLGGSFREVRLAVSDLARGAWRMTRAMARQTATAAGALLLLLRRGGIALGKALDQARGPVGEAAHWVWNRGKEGAVAMSRSARGGARLGRRAAQGLRWVPVVARGGARLLLTALRWTAKAAGLAALGAVTLLTLAVAVAALVAPDVVGFGVYLAQSAFGEFLRQVRLATVVTAGPELQQQFDSSGAVAGNVALLATAMLLLVWGMMIVRSYWRRRQSVAGN